ncbi:hypothetical protein V6N13_081114 [Hibiscus sabdariffa]
MTLSRIRREFHPAALNNPQLSPHLLSMLGVIGCPYRYRVHLSAPGVSPYVGHDFVFAIKFDGDLFHPNFNESGDIQVDRLIERCSFAFSVTNIFMAIMGLQIAPNPDEPHLDFVGVALIYKKSLESFAKYVRKIMG